MYFRKFLAKKIPELRLSGFKFSVSGFRVSGFKFKASGFRV